MAAFCTHIEQDNSGEIEEREMKDMFCKLCRIVTREKEKLNVERTRAESEVPGFDPSIRRHSGI
jgi:hypothetical protein